MAAITAELIDSVCAQFSQDGLSFEVVALDDNARTVDIQLSLADAKCADCVLPAGYLASLIEASLVKRTDAHYTVALHDPRIAQTKTTTVATAEVVGARIVILDPVATPRAGNTDPGPDAGPLGGKTVLFRLDVLWESWDWIVDEWSKQLAAAGVTTVIWRRSQGSVGDTADRAQAEYDALIEQADALICGLGNCGSCTAATVVDALRGLCAQRPTVTIVTEQFHQLAQVLAEDGGRSGLRIVALPHPLSQRPEQEVREIARDALSGVVQKLGATL
jgi:hypothetical protein